MKEKQSSNFLIGLLIGVLVGVLIWYWQKSTSADEGALDLLDRLAAAETKLRQMRAELSGRQSGGHRLVVAPAPVIEAEPAPLPVEPDDLQTVRGIGPVFGERLHQAGVNTFAQLAAASADDLAGILQVNGSRAQAILAEVQGMAA